MAIANGRYVFDITTLGEPGSWALGNRRVFAHCDKGFPDGIKCDTWGNVYSGCGDGVHVDSNSVDGTNERCGIHLDVWLARLRWENLDVGTLSLAPLEHCSSLLKLGFIEWILQRKELPNRFSISDWLHLF
jgi:hypothetical protein